MSTEVLSQNLTAGVTAYFGSGSVFVITAAVGAVTVVARTLGSSNKNRVFTGVPAGFKFTADSPDDGFDTLEVTSPINQAFSIAVGSDDVEFSNAVTVTGGVVTQETPASVVSDIAGIATTAGRGAIIAANGARRRVTLFAEPANPAPVYIAKTAGVNIVAILQAGMSLEFAGTYGLDFIADPGGNSIRIFEES